MITLILNGITLNLTKDTFKKKLSGVAKNQTSEGGTTLRSVTRLGIPTYSIRYKCDGLEESRLEALAKEQMLTATLFDETTRGNIRWQCYMDEFNSELIVEDDETRYYKVSFTLNDLES